MRNGLPPRIRSRHPEEDVGKALVKSNGVAIWFAMRASNGKRQKQPLPTTYASLIISPWQILGADCAVVEPQKASCETLSLKRSGYLTVAGKLGRLAVPSSAL
jgi:hypothetical protein